MDIFELNKILLKIAGLSVTPVNHKYYKWLPHMWLGNILCLIVASITFVVLERPPISDATQIFYCIGCSTQFATKFALIWRRKNDVIAQMDALQEIVDESEYFSEYATNG